jgi:predicted ArsR family transcriptional regulator
MKYTMLLRRYLRKRWTMARGRKPSTSETRVLLELLLTPNRAVFTGEIADELPIDTERVRQIMSDLDDAGYVETKKVSGRNLYRLTDKGHEKLAEELRELVD